MRLFYPPPFPAARPPPRSYPGGHAFFVSHRTTVCRCTEGGGGYASWTIKPKWRWCQVAPGSRGHVGRTPGMPLPVRNHPRVQRCEGHWSGGVGGSGHSPRLSCTRAPPVRTRKRRATPCARARGSARGRQKAPPLAVHARSARVCSPPLTTHGLPRTCDTTPPEKPAAGLDLT